MAPVSLGLYVYLIVDDFSLLCPQGWGTLCPPENEGDDTYFTDREVRSKWGGVWKALSQSSINDITITDFLFTTIPI